MCKSGMDCQGKRSKGKYRRVAKYMEKSDEQGILLK